MKKLFSMLAIACMAFIADSCLKEQDCFTPPSLLTPS